MVSMNDKLMDKVLRDAGLEASKIGCRVDVQTTMRKVYVNPVEQT
ncbi:MAG: hypothetical protein QOJ13_2779 [Gaiellales bacterium]|jgi:hypothetical protein|nr:hypothetical protein [Gaiellales bacterium]